jgi:hypothetical protein
MMTINDQSVRAAGLSLPRVASPLAFTWHASRVADVDLYRCRTFCRGYVLFLPPASRRCRGFTARPSG